MIHGWLYVSGDPSHQGRNESHGAAFAAELARLREAGEDLATEEEYVVCGDTSEDRLQGGGGAFPRAPGAAGEHHSGACEQGGGAGIPIEAEWQDCCAAVSRTKPSPSVQLHDPLPHSVPCFADVW